ncbi:LysR family transcriptional regulator [Lacticaseibacillus daqingensis]|uniref:LysR family transcriptional regulator n=1 Tax=Lacticaseibacillus daqingensis TaxID=2486014 RepID=UPI000F7A4D1B|nr:LysR family transcriptional regulator [Lacticaseibacillus daqingensis]
MNTRDLAYFEQLCVLGNFSQVAAHFGVSQPTITMALKRLEAQFGTQLMVRDKSHAQLVVTPAGQQLAARARVINRELALATAELARADTPKIQLGLPPIIGSTYFPRFAPALRDAGLMPQLVVHEHGSTRLLTQLRTGHLDAALLGASGPLVAPGLHREHLASVPFTLVVPRDHPLADRTALSFADTEALPFVTLTESFVHSKALAWFASTSNTPPNVVFTTPDVGSLKQLVHAHVGVALLAAVAVSPADDLVAIPLDDPGQPRFEVQLVTAARLVPRPTLRDFIQILTTPQEGDPHAH